jgi:hypothetical protein
VVLKLPRHGARGVGIARCKGLLACQALVLLQVLCLEVNLVDRGWGDQQDRGSVGGDRGVRDDGLEVGTVLF